eukprot:IDg21722t1
MNANRAKNVLRQLEERNAEREHELSKFSTSKDVDSDDEADQPSPIFDSFYESSGTEGIVKMCNFTPLEFRKLYSHLHGEITREWNTGRGKRSEYKAMDVLFMILVVMKHEGSWDQMGNMFRIKGPTFQRLITGFMDKMRKYCVERFVSRIAKTVTMEYCINNRHMFKNFLYALEAVDVTFQQANRPCGNMQEGKVYFSGKHKLYGFKVEVAVRPNGLATAFSNHYPGSISDMTIFTERARLLQRRLKKSEDEDKYADEYYLSEEYPDYWTILADKRYQGAHEFTRAVTQRKNRLAACFAQKMRSSTASTARTGFWWKTTWEGWDSCGLSFLLSTSVRIVVQHHFCVGSIFHKLSCRMHKLRSDDLDWYNSYRNRLFAIGDDKKRKNNEAQAKYRRKRKFRLNSGFRSV